MKKPLHSFRKMRITPCGYGHEVAEKVKWMRSTVRTAPVLACTLLVVLCSPAGRRSAFGAESSADQALAAPLFPRINVTRGDRHSGLIALTFDDAPHPTYVPRLLSLLKAENAKATFYLVGSNLKNFPTLARKIVEEGHEVGNHSLTHASLTKADLDGTKEEILGMQKLMQERIGLAPRTYRPAFGAVNTKIKDVCEENGLDIILWDVDTNDWRSASTSTTIINEVLDNATSGSIVLFHATKERTVQAIAELIPVLRYRGYKLVTVSELLRDRAAREKARREGTGDDGTSAAASDRATENDTGPSGTAPIAPIKSPVLPGP